MKSHTLKGKDTMVKESKGAKGLKGATTWIKGQVSPSVEKMSFFPPQKKLTIKQTNEMLKMIKKLKPKSTVKECTCDKQLGVMSPICKVHKKEFKKNIKWLENVGKDTMVKERKHVWCECGECGRDNSQFCITHEKYCKSTVKDKRKKYSKAHLVGLCGAFSGGTSYGSICLECGKKTYDKLPKPKHKKLLGQDFIDNCNKINEDERECNCKRCSNGDIWTALCKKHNPENEKFLECINCHKVFSGLINDLCEDCHPQNNMKIGGARRINNKPRGFPKSGDRLTNPLQSKNEKCDCEKYGIEYYATCPHNLKNKTENENGWEKEFDELMAYDNMMGYIPHRLKQFIRNLLSQYKEKLKFQDESIKTLSRALNKSKLEVEKEKKRTTKKDVLNWLFDHTKEMYYQLLNHSKHI